MPDASRFHEHELGSSWTQTEMQVRGSHALVSGGRVWLIDPVDSDGDVDRAIGGNEAAAVIQLLDRHTRDCVEVAARLGVPHLRLPTELAGAPFTPFSLIDRPGWREVGLWWPEHNALIIAEAIGSMEEIAVADTGIAVHPLLRLTPPGALRKYPEAHHLLPGHGKPIHAADTGERIQTALDRSRRDLPSTLKRLPAMIRAARA
jgi:hypothetical protein